MTDAPQCDHFVGIAYPTWYSWHESAPMVTLTEETETQERHGCSAIAERFDYCPKCGQRLTPTKVERE